MVTSMRLEYTINKSEHQVFVTRIGQRLDTSMLYGDSWLSLLPSQYLFSHIIKLIYCLFVNAERSTQDDIYELYTSNEEEKLAIEFKSNVFESTFSGKIKSYLYTDIKSIERVGNFAIIWLKQAVTRGSKSTPIGIPIYSNAFKEITRSRFISLLQSKSKPRPTDFILNV